MSLWNDVSQYDFTASNVKKIPKKAGVYFLFCDSKLIYIGGSDGTRTSNIQSRLLAHLNGNDRCILAADKFSHKVSARGKDLEQKLLKQYKQDYGQLPRCNDVI